jgi:hypothetical protein
MASQDEVPMLRIGGRNRRRDFDSMPRCDAVRVARRETEVNGTQDDEDDSEDHDASQANAGGSLIQLAPQLIVAGEVVTPVEKVVVHDVAPVYA